MHGIIQPIATEDTLEREGLISKILNWGKRKRAFLGFVILPTLIAVGYYYMIAADQYLSEAHFVVRTTDQAQPATGGLGQMLSLAGAGPSQSESISVADYLTSNDAVMMLRSKLGLVERFRRPEADVITRLRSDTPTPEALLKYYRSQVDVHLNSDTGITTLRVKAFRPGDAFTIASSLLRMGEARVNMLNVRGYNDALTMSRRQLAEAESAIADTQRRMTAFRQDKRDIDPAGSGEAQLKLVSGLNASLAQARARLAAMRGFIDTSSPQYAAMAAQVRALEVQSRAEAASLAGGGTAIAADLGDYEELKVRQTFAAKRYEVAAAAYERARDQAMKQQLYIVRIVEPNMPMKALYPERLRIVFTIFLGLLITYALGWLIAAGVREHAA